MSDRNEVITVLGDRKLIGTLTYHGDSENLDFISMARVYHELYVIKSEQHGNKIDGATAKPFDSLPIQRRIALADAMKSFCDKFAGVIMELSISKGDNSNDDHQPPTD